MDPRKHNDRAIASKQVILLIGVEIAFWLLVAAGTIWGVFFI